MLQRWLFSRRLVYLLVVAMLAGGAAAGLWWKLQGQYAAVPRVAGTSLTTARGDLRGDGFTTRRGAGQNSSTTPAGEVLATRPGAGARARRGAIVTIVVSLGPRRVLVPAVTGLPLATAESLLASKGLRYTRAPAQVSATVPAGEVISTTPGRGTNWPVNQPVRIVASAGPPLPAFTGQQVAAAEVTARNGRYTLNPVQDVIGTDPKGTIVRQSPAPGSAITPGEVVTVHYSPGPPLTAIPDVTGMPSGMAIRLLTRDGFKVRVNGGLFGNRVTGYSPSGRARPGTTITIHVGYF